MISDDLPKVPYAPASAVLKCIDQFREGGFRGELTSRALVEAGVARGNVPRTVAALKFLGLVNDQVRPTNLSTELGSLPQAEYRSLLARMVKTSYQEVFERVDPATSTRTALLEAFRIFDPLKRRQEMVTLFQSLCRESGIIAGPRPTRRSGSDRRATVSLEPSPSYSEVIADGQNPRLLMDLVRSLPEKRRWSDKEKEAWLKAFVAVLDLLVEVEQGEQGQQPRSSEDAREDSLMQAS